MFTYLPAYYEGSRVMRADMNAKGAELDLLFTALDETLQQFFVRTATWGLDRWESELGIETDLSKPLEQRRAVVESRLRGSGKFSGPLVKSVAEAYGGEVKVSFQPERWSFILEYIETIPPNLHDLRAIMEEIKPAHLAWTLLWRSRTDMINDIRNIVKLRLRSRVPFFGGQPWYLDGMQQLDGTVSLSGWTGERQWNRQRLEIRISHHIPNKQDGIIKARQNYWLLDGSVRFDGSCLLNSLEKIIVV
ncbi:putative phage tail protein [Paenibacillus sanguinis]|uniref:putative phage tail protein n=1 Tax=Paenibacillus sanguinis TaxID=225906 RepID=UPI0003A4F932|nr:putative phage tail protein [Paenibacillus sanguinis]